MCQWNECFPFLSNYIIPSVLRGTLELESKIRFLKKWISFLIGYLWHAKLESIFILKIRMYSRTWRNHFVNGTLNSFSRFVNWYPIVSLKGEYLQWFTVRLSTGSFNYLVWTTLLWSETIELCQGHVDIGMWPYIIRKQNKHPTTISILCIHSSLR